MKKRMLGDYLGLALANISHRRTRSFLTVIGIFIGITAIVALVSIGQGLQDAVSAQFESLGKDKITVLGTTGLFSSPFASEISANPLTISDLEAVRKTRGVELAADVLIKTGKIEYGQEFKNTIVIGYPLDETRKLFEEFGGFEIVEGRKLRAGDGRKAVLGGYAADGLFKKKIRAGESVEVQGRRYEVAGVFKKTGDRFGDGAVYAPIEVMRKDFNEEKLASEIFAKTVAGAVPAEVAEEIRDNLADRRGERKGEESFSVSTSEQLLQTFTSIFGVVQLVVVGLAAISLVVGGIGIMNTMYTSVLERTKEIGIMKALGARNGDVLALFLIESGLLGLVGGLLGVAAGFGLGKIVERVAEQAVGAPLLKVFFPPELAAAAMLFSFAVGTISGALPAMRAASLKPVEALRY